MTPNGSQITGYNSGDIIPVGFTGDTVTLGTAITMPTIASYTVNFIFAKDDNLYVFYRLTASPYTVSEGRRWNGASWSNLTGTALPTSVLTANDSAI